MDILCRILKKLVNHRQETGTKATNIYLGNNDYKELQDYANHNFGIGLESKAISMWFDEAKIIEVYLENHINVC